MREYIAKRRHKCACTYCGVEILPGDLVVNWLWNREDEVTWHQLYAHRTCHVLADDLEEWVTGRAFHEGVPADAEHPDGWKETPLVAQAAAALASARGVMAPALSAEKVLEDAPCDCSSPCGWRHRRPTREVLYRVGGRPATKEEWERAAAAVGATAVTKEWRP